ncbi:MAG TPA: septation protein SepH [Jatrophihabitans sp.]|jgi:hypothetical protein|nr:septation protein SepH [Jatrophihabitans sp.]
MRLLRLVGPGEDGTSLIVEAVEAGNLESERFALALDDRLRTMTSSASPASPATAAQNQEAEMPVESRGPVPTPREIQVRVRAGETAQAVADEAGIPLERVMRFAYPVLQERVRVTDEARRARARRGGDGLLVPFGELIDSRLARHGVDPGSVRWDAYRREDGGWTVAAQVSSHERDVLAKFSFALVNRTVSALDDVAADLLSDRPVQALLAPAPPAAEPVADSAGADWAPDWDGAAPPRLTAVPNPGRTDPPRSQDAGPAVRPPSRRQKAHTRPVPINADDELFDQDAFEQQPWHEPPLPFEAGTGGRGGAPAPRHRAQRRAGETASTSEPVRPAQPEIAEAGAADPANADSVNAGSISLGRADVEVRFEPASDAPVDDDPATGDDFLAGMEQASPVGVAAGAGDPQHKRGRRAGEKPRMPSWDDILLGVRHKSD